jgi:Transglycosylase SLT domain
MPIPAAFNRATRTVRTTAARPTRTQKVSAVVVGVLGASVLAGSVVPGMAQAAEPHSSTTAVSTTRAAEHPAPAAKAPKKTQAIDAVPTSYQSSASGNAQSSVQGGNLDGWINQALKIMHQRNIPGSFSGIKRNILRESSGNPQAINRSDINAQNGVPSKGLLQVIQPTFAQYHVSGTSSNVYDPVANIAAASNYAAHRYGSMDNVNSAY